MIASCISGSGISWPKPSIMTTAVARAGDDQVEVALLHLLGGRQRRRTGRRSGRAGWPPIGPRKGTRASMQRGRGADHRRHVGVVLAVGRDRPGLDLDLVAVRLGEERADRPVDEPRGQDLLGGRPPLALDEAAGELARGVDLLAIIDRQGEEVEALAAGGGDGGDQASWCRRPGPRPRRWPAWPGGRSRVKSHLPPIVRSTVTGFRVAKDVLDMNVHLLRPTAGRGAAMARWDVRRIRRCRDENTGLRAIPATGRNPGSGPQAGQTPRPRGAARGPGECGRPRRDGPAAGDWSRPADYLRMPRRPITSR